MRINSKKNRNQCNHIRPVFTDLYCHWKQQTFTVTMPHLNRGTVKTCFMNKERSKKELLNDSAVFTVKQRWNSTPIWSCFSLANTGNLRKIPVQIYTSSSCGINWLMSKDSLSNSHKLHIVCPAEGVKRHSKYYSTGISEKIPHVVQTVPQW